MSPAALEHQASGARIDGAAAPAWRRALVFGTGLGVAIGERNLEVAIVRARPSGASLEGATTVADFRSRPAAEWGADVRRLVAAAGESRLAATLLLPRDETIVRTLALPGVADKDAAAAIELQIDSLHPWGDDDVAWGWSRAGGDRILVGLTRKETLSAWETLFTEAGIPVAAVTFSAAVFHAALRIWNIAPVGFVGMSTDARGRTEVYGESESRAVFSAEFPGTAERAIALSRAELRLAPDEPVRLLADLLPRERSGKSVPEAAVPAYAAALAGSATRVAKFANLLPAERRASHDRVQYLIPGVLGVLLVLSLVAVFVIFPALEQRRYRTDLERAARQVEPLVRRAQSLEKKITSDRAKIAALDDFRQRPQADLDVLHELTRLLPPPIWTNSVEIYPDYAIVAGEADQAAPLLKVLDSSPLFRNSEFTLTPARNDKVEQFRIKTLRRGRTGRTTP